MPSPSLLFVCAAAAALCSGAAATLAVQPALDLIGRNFGPAAALAFNLTIDTSGKACAGVRGRAPAAASGQGARCFALSEQDGKVSITASTMSDLTYGIGYYTRFSCGLTVSRRPVTL